MKTITVPGTDDTFTVTVAPADDITLVDVYDSINEPVASVAVHHDGSTEWEWRTESYLYANRSRRWWNGLRHAARTAVA